MTRDEAYQAALSVVQSLDEWYVDLTSPVTERMRAAGAFTERWCVSFPGRRTCDRLTVLVGLKNGEQVVVHRWRKYGPLLTKGKEAELAAWLRSREASA